MLSVISQKGNGIGSVTHPCSGVQGNLGCHATRFDRLLDPGVSWWPKDLRRLLCSTDTTGPILKSFEAMWLSGVSGFGNCDSCGQWGSPKLLARVTTFRLNSDAIGLGGSTRL